MWFEQISDESAVALLWSRLGAKQRDVRRPRGRVQGLRDAAIIHQSKETGFVGWPVLVLSVGLKQIGSGGEQGLVGIGDVCNFIEEEGQI